MYVQVMAPNGRCYQITTRQTETLLKAWLDEILPDCHWHVDGEELWPRVNVQPSWAGVGGTSNPDWLTDSRAICGIYEMRAVNGEQGLASLLRLRRRLERWLRDGADPRSLEWRDNA